MVTGERYVGSPPGVVGPQIVCDGTEPRPLSHHLLHLSVHGTVNIIQGGSRQGRPVRELLGHSDHFILYEEVLQRRNEVTFVQTYIIS